MTEHIPFVTSDDGAQLVARYYADSEFVRVPLDRVERLRAALPKGPKIWLEPCVDGMDDLDTRRPDKEKRRRNAWFDFMSAFPGFEDVASPTFHVKPNAADVEGFVKAILDQCASHKPAWITVPQLPLVEDAERNKINRALAKATGKWCNSNGFSGRLILPIVITHQSQVNGKVARNAKIKVAERCYQEAQASGYWVVDKSLSDDCGSSTLRNKRFPGLIAFHEEIGKQISSTIRIGGPYWGLNLVLWARGLIDFPAIGVGSSFQYYLAGGHANTASAKVALPALRRRAGVGQLGPWLDETLAALGPAHPSYKEFSEIKAQLVMLNQQSRAKDQVARFYKRWFDTIASAPPAGRSMALFQDLSAAYALGKSLGPLSDDEGTARRPEAVAEPLMLSCL